MLPVCLDAPAPVGSPVLKDCPGPARLALAVSRAETRSGDKCSHWHSTSRKWERASHIDGYSPQGLKILLQSWLAPLNVRYYTCTDLGPGLIVPTTKAIFNPPCSGTHCQTILAEEFYSSSKGVLGFLTTGIRFVLWVVIFMLG